MPLFSIITICYNVAETIERTLESVDCQTFGDYEHLIVDGASTDKTVDMVIARANPRRRLISERDNGLYDAMNKGIVNTSGKYLIFLNAGDKFHDSGILDAIAETISSNGSPGIVYGQTDIVDNNGCRIGPRHLSAPSTLTFRSFASGMLVCHQAFVALRRIAPKFDTGYRFSADYKWCVECLKNSRCNVGLTDTVFIDYLNEGVTTKNRIPSLIERFKIMSFYYGFLPTVFRHAGFVFRALKRRLTTSK